MVNKVSTIGLTLLLMASSAAFAASSGGEAKESNLFAGDLGNMVWTLVVFLMVIFVLGKFAWGPLLEKLQERESFIRDSLTQAKEGQEKSEALLKEYSDKLDSARAEATEIVEEGRRDAEAVRAKIEEQAREESEKMIARAKREIDLATQTALKELYTTSGSLATGIASRVVGRELTPQDHERLIEEAISEMTGNAN